MFKVQHIINGFYTVTLDTFTDAQSAVDAIKDHVRVNSAITHPVYAKSMSGDSVRIDYGAKDYYYLITLTQDEDFEKSEFMTKKFNLPKEEEEND